MFKDFKEVVVLFNGILSKPVSEKCPFVLVEQLFWCLLCFWSTTGHRSSRVKFQLFRRQTKILAPSFDFIIEKSPFFLSPLSGDSLDTHNPFFDTIEPGFLPLLFEFVEVSV